MESSPFSSADALTLLLVYAFTRSQKFFWKSKLNLSLIKASLYQLQLNAVFAVFSLVFHHNLPCVPCCQWDQSIPVLALQSRPLPFGSSQLSTILIPHLCLSSLSLFSLYRQRPC